MKGVGVLIGQQIGNLLDRQIAVVEIAQGHRAPGFGQDIVKGDICRPKFPQKPAPAFR